MAHGKLQVLVGVFLAVQAANVLRNCRTGMRDPRQNNHEQGDQLKIQQMVSLLVQDGPVCSIIYPVRT